MRLRFVAICTTAAAIAAAGCSDEYAALSPTTPPEQFTAALAGAGVTTTASGTGTVTLRDSTTARYEVAVANITAVTAAHIHAGATGQAGPILATLFTTTTPTRAIAGGVLRQGDITPATRFTAPFTFDALVAQVRAGTAYVDVHTTANPGGEIRGQLTPAATTAGGR